MIIKVYEKHKNGHKHTHTSTHTYTHTDTYTHVHAHIHTQLAVIVSLYMGNNCDITTGYGPLFILYVT